MYINKSEFHNANEKYYILNEKVCYYRVLGINVYYFNALFCFIANKFYPSFGIILFQIFFVCSITLLSSIFLKRSVSHNVILFVLTVFQLFATIWARIFNKIQYHNYLGFEPADAQFYHDIGTRFSDSSFSVYDMFIFFESNS